MKIQTNKFDTLKHLNFKNIEEQVGWPQNIKILNRTRVPVDATLRDITNPIYITLNEQSEDL